MLQLLSFGKKTIKNTLSVYIKTNTGNTLSIDLNPKWDIKNVKEIVAPQLGLEPDELKIIFAGKELDDNIIIEECDLGQKSILHAVSTTRPQHQSMKSRTANATKQQKYNVLAEEPSDDNLMATTTSSTPTATPTSSSTSTSIMSNKPLSQTLLGLDMSTKDRLNISDENKIKAKAHFFVYCTKCNELCTGKLRVRCSQCKGGAFTVHSDPECWQDVLQKSRIRGHCESLPVACVDTVVGDPPFAEFYFKCSQHVSEGEQDFAVPLDLIRPNVNQISCLACSDVNDPVLVFSCADGHVTCLDCFRHYCASRLMDRQFLSHPDIGYTLACPVGCENSFIAEIHHFKLLTTEQYDRYQRFATEEFVLQAGGVLCPQPNCGMGLLVDDDCNRITCEKGCGYVFCRNCRQGYHLGEECPTDDNAHGGKNSTECDEYNVNLDRVAGARWDEASNVTIKVLTKPCPQCRTPTERAGGCMHMVCTRSGCGLEWCWVCQTTWTRDCMGAHWFG